MRCLKRDIERAKRIFLQKKYEKRAIDYKGSRVIDWDHPGAPIFPNHVQFSIVDNFLSFEGVRYWEISLYKDSPVNTSIVSRNK